MRLSVFSLAAAMLGSSVVAGLVVVTPAAAIAQVGSSTDIITGRVTGADGKPIANAEVAVLSAETGITRRKKTNADGRYTILFPDGGGQYRVEFKAIGYEPIIRNIARQGDEDRMTADVQMGSAATRLAGVDVTARRGEGGARQTRENPTPGDAGRQLGAEQLARMPVDASDLAAVAALAPGVVPISATDTSAASFSVAGQRESLNNITLDGLSVGNFSMPQEGMRSTRVVTNTYDPSRGRFTGGQVNSTTRGGTNDLTGAFNYSRRDPSLQFEGNDTSTFAPQFLQDQISGGLGGPLVRDKLFIYGSGQFRRRSDPFQSILSASPATMAASGVSPDSVARFINTVDGYGVPVQLGDLPGRRIGDNTSTLLRVDYLVTDAHTLTLRGDFSRAVQDPTQSSLYTLPTNTGTNTRNSGGMAVTLTSYFESGIINEFKSYYTRSTNTSNGFLYLPAGRSRINSERPDGTLTVSTLSFGGNPSLPQRGNNASLQLSNEASYLTRNRAHRIKLGLLFENTRFRQDITNNLLGTFTYNSLEDFANNVPSSFTRTLNAQERLGSTTSGTLYAADTWRRGRAQFVYGLRAEMTRVGYAPALNADVHTQFGYRTDKFPTEFHVSPRVGFSINLTRPDTSDRFAQFRPAFIVRGGIGEFRAVTPDGLYTSAQTATGLPGTAQQLNCLGSAVPVPDWNAYMNDISAVPTECVGGGSTPPAYSSLQRSVTVFDPNFQAPRAWRGSLGAQHRVFNTLTFSADVSYARGIALYGATDLNLNSTPSFTLANEGNRPVFVPLSAIVPENGGVSFAGSRIDDQYGHVLKLASNLKSDTRQLTLGLNGPTIGGAFFNLSYTLTRTRDQSTFNCCSASQGFSSPTTGGNPNELSWAPSDQDVRHILQGNVSKSVTSYLDVTMNARLSSGRPLTPLVSSDINGDGARNDRAFIFDPSVASDPGVAAGMQQLLATAPGRIQECLKSQMGHVAGRNSCRGPWTPTLDMQANIRPDGFGLRRRVMFSLVTSNVLAGLDQLLHQDLRGWGQSNRADPVLLYVRGFDPGTRTFQYDVNGNFGDNNTSRNVFRVPFVVSLQMRVSLRPDPRARWQQMFNTRVNSMSSGTSAVMNPIARIIQLKDSLQLTDVQIGRLTFISDTLAAHTRELGDSIRAKSQEVGTSDMRKLMDAIRPLMTRGTEAMTGALTKAQEILTPEQWAKVGGDIRNPMRGPMGGGQGGAPGGGPAGGGRRPN